MVRFSWGIMVGILAVLWVAGSAAAERRLALVIGNSNYAIGPLTNPGRDSALMAQVLKESGFEVTQMTDLAYRDMQRAVVGFGRDLRAAGEDTVGLVYYAGHAIQANGENYLVPVDADLQDVLDLDIQTLQVSVLMRGLETAGNRLNMVVLDACRNNPFKSMSRSGSRGLAKVDAPSGTLLAFSTAPGDVASDGTGANSPYTTALARAIRTPGLPVEQVFKRVRVDVMEKTGNQQVPWESSSLTGDFFFKEPVSAPVAVSPEPAAAPPANDQATEIAYWTTIAASNDPAQFKAYLATFPNGAFRSLAEQRIAALEDAARQQADIAAKQAQEAAAAQLWSAVENTGDPALMQTVIDRYPGTVYAQLAGIKIEALKARSAAPPAAAAPPSQNDSRKETLFWESIQYSSNPADYQAYLDQFPNGSFTALAQDRIQNGYTPQVASLPNAAAAHPYDGDWELSWKVIGGFKNRLPWCRDGEKGAAKIRFENGYAEGGISSNFGSYGQIRGDFARTGALSMSVRISSWNGGGMKVNMQVDPNALSIMRTRNSKCQAEFALSRVK